MLKKRDVAPLSLEEKIDTSSAAGELLFHVFGATAHFERRLIAERTRDGIAAARGKSKLGRQRDETGGVTTTRTELIRVAKLSKTRGPSHGSW